MKKKFNVLIPGLLLPLILLGQKPLRKAEVLEDYQMLKDILTQGHPSLYEYTSQTEWERLFTEFEQEKLKTIQNDTDVYRSIAELTDHVRDGHLIVMRPLLDPIPHLFPLLLKIIDGKLYTDTDDFGFPIGSEILSIDGIGGTELRKRFMKYAPSDGYNTTKKDRQVEREFGILHFYEFGAKPSYQIVGKTPSGEVITKIVESQSFESIGKRFGQRNSYVGRPSLGKKEPFLYFVDSLQTAVLTINTFGLHQERFQSIQKELFKEIKKRKSEHLVIDLRQNEGGYPENANYTFRHIAKEPFMQPVSQHVVISQLPHQENSQEVINGISYASFFEKYFQNAEKEDNEWVMYAPKKEATLTPAKKGFEGQVYVLIGGQTFSAGATFALNCKNQGIPLIGEETGGGYAVHTGGYPVIYELPNSKVKVLISFVKVKKYVKDGTVKKGTGVVPDVEIQPTVQDLIESRDVPLDYVWQQIGNK